MCLHSKICVSHHFVAVACSVNRLAPFWSLVDVKIYPQQAFTVATLSNRTEQRKTITCVRTAHEASPKCPEDSALQI